MKLREGHLRRGAMTRPHSVLSLCFLKVFTKKNCNGRQLLTLSYITGKLMEEVQRLYAVAHGKREILEQQEGALEEAFDDVMPAVPQVRRSCTPVMAGYPFKQG